VQKSTIFRVRTFVTYLNWCHLITIQVIAVRKSLLSVLNSLVIHSSARDPYGGSFLVQHYQGIIGFAVNIISLNIIMK